MPLISHIKITSTVKDLKLLDTKNITEPRREKTGFLHVCENKDADQLRSNREADQRLCFRYMDSTIPLLPKHEISSLYPSFVVVQPGLCRTWSDTPKTIQALTVIILELQDIGPNSKECIDGMNNSTDPENQSDLGLHCSHRSVCPKT